MSSARGAVIGLTGGLFSGLLGIGGGTVMVPLLVLWAGCEQRVAHAMSLVAIIPISAAAVLVYGGAGEVDPAAAVALSLGAVFGARLGASLLTRAPERVLKAAFGVFMLVAAALIAVDA
ncbi:MAG: TSUP family transporter [Solirubrobacterales bacterium]|nr:TSUP family transporter [Solirubrobacterales bacterium]